MDTLATDVAVELPDKAARAAAQGPYARKPLARVRFSCEDGHGRVILVPARVARALDDIDALLPAPFDEIKGHVGRVQDRMCFAVLVDMLARRDHGEQEARDKLERAGYRAVSIDRAIERARAARYLDDARFMRTFIEERKRRGWGRRKIEQALFAKHADPSQLEGYPQDYFDDEDDLSRAREMLASRPIPAGRAFDKLVRRLMAKGFSYGVAADAARERLAAPDA